jgi:hypothetical protein
VVLEPERSKVSKECKGVHQKGMDIFGTFGHLWDKTDADVSLSGLVDAPIAASVLPEKLPDRMPETPGKQTKDNTNISKYYKANQTIHPPVGDGATLRDAPEANTTGDLF